MPKTLSRKKPCSANHSNPKKSRRTGFPDRLSPLNYIASLVRSDIYLKDYQAYQEALESERRGRKHESLEQTSGNATSGFLRHWLMLKKPIPPEKAKKDPAEFVNHLVPPVFFETEVPESWYQDGEIARLPGSNEALFLPAVWINFMRTKEEILDHIGRMVDEWSFLGTSRPERKKDCLERWRIWDTYCGGGGGSTTKTAEILYPKEFNYWADKGELKKETKEEYDRRINSGEKASKVMMWHDNRLASAKASRWRINQRKKLKAYLRGVIISCERMIAFHSLPMNLKVHVIQRDNRIRPKKK